MTVSSFPLSARVNFTRCYIRVYALIRKTITSRRKVIKCKLLHCSSLICPNKFIITLLLILLFINIYINHIFSPIFLEIRSSLISNDPCHRRLSCVVNCEAILIVLVNDARISYDRSCFLVFIDKRRNYFEKSKHNYSKLLGRHANILDESYADHYNFST